MILPGKEMSTTVPVVSRDNGLRLAALLVAIYIMSILLHVWLLWNATSFPHISSDEVQWALTAENLSRGNGYVLRGQFNSSAPPLYPLMLAAAYCIGGHSRDWALLVACIVMCSALFPAFYLARYFGVGPRNACILAAAISLLPHTLYAGTLMSETLQFPLFLLTFYGILRWLDSPNWTKGIIVGFGIGLMLLVKIQTTQLIGALVITLLIYLARTWRRERNKTASLACNMLLLIGTAVATQLGWQVYKHLHGGSTLGQYGDALQHGLPNWTWSLTAAYFADFLLASGLITAVPVYWWLHQVRKVNPIQATFIASTLLLQFAAVSTLDGGLTGWLRERLFIYSLAIMAILAVRGLQYIKESSAVFPRMAMLLAPPLLVCILMLYPFHVSSVIEVPWANALGSFNGHDFNYFFKMRLAIVASFLSLLMALFVLAAPKAKSALALAGFILVFNGFGLFASSRGLTAWSAVGLREAGPLLQWLSANHVRPGERLLISGRHAYFEAKQPFPPDDGAFLDWTWHLGLSEALEWQIETLGRFDVRMIPSPEELVSQVRAGDRFLTAARFENLELVSYRYPMYLYRAGKRLADVQRPVYRVSVPAEKFYTLVGRRTLDSIEGDGSRRTGYLVYGPYLPMAAGSYRAKFKIAGDRNLRLAFNVSGDHDRLLNNRSTTLSQMDSLEFHTDGIEKLQYRIIGESSENFQFSGVDLDYIGNQPISEEPGAVAAAAGPGFSQIVPHEIVGRKLASIGSCFIDLVNGNPPATSLTIKGRDGIRMAGWAADTRTGSVPETAVVELSSTSKGNYYARVERNQRPDVANALSMPSLAGSGFSLAASADSIPPGTYSVKILQSTGQTGSECDPKRYLELR